MSQQQLSDRADSASARPSPARGIAGQIVANTSLLIALLVYMGWAYEAAYFGYFHINPFDLDIGIIEYMLVSLNLFSPVLVVTVAILVLVSVARTWHLDRTDWSRSISAKAAGRLWPAHFLGRLTSADSAERSQAGRRLLIGAGATVTVIALALALIARYVPVSTYVVLALLASGPMLLTWPTRADRHGRFPYALAIILAAVCTLWAASLYATYLGKHAAGQVAHDISARPAVILYSIQPLALNGPGVQIQALPAGSFYHYRYQGLRLLSMRSGTYYLLPVRWNPHVDPTYIINDSDEIRVELH